jgi:hypothetical protein
MLQLGALAERLAADGGGYECAIRLRMFADACLPVVQDHPWVVREMPWSPAYWSDSRSAMLSRLLEDGGVHVLGLTKPPRPVDIAVISLLVGHRPQLPSGWSAAGLRPSEVIALERDHYRDRLKKRRRAARKVGATAQK